MSKPWEMRLSVYEIDRFKIVVEHLKTCGKSDRCPFLKCSRCRYFCRGLKKIKNMNNPFLCPCSAYQSKSLIWRIEKLLSYNKQLRSNSE